ncbi:MAG: FAD-binding oxidoreductase, partial [Dehalococcoidia bacterium]|nr:FAD-binding oxidoreductase [Dehalococcoidia bacterium]
GLDGAQALLVIGFESSDVPQGDFMRQAVAIARDAGGKVDDDNIIISDEPGRATGREGSVGAWRDSFINAPYQRNITTGLGLVEDTLETAVTWDQWPKLDAAVREAIQNAMNHSCRGGTVTCRFTHVYPDGPAPYFTFSGFGQRGGELEAHQEIKRAASEAIMATGGTITHHHAVGRLHKPWYQGESPDLFLEVLRAAKGRVDGRGVMNPGVLFDG